MTFLHGSGYFIYLKSQSFNKVSIKILEFSMGLFENFYQKNLVIEALVFCKAPMDFTNDPLRWIT